MTQWINIFWVMLLLTPGNPGNPRAVVAWPTSDTSKIKLLGLFESAENASTPDRSSVHARAMFNAAVALSQWYNMTIDGQSAETSGDIIDTLSIACQAVSNATILGIVGPSLSREVHVIAPFGDRIGIPVISYAATDPDLSDRNKYPTFYRTVPSDKAAAAALAQLFLRFNWTSCVIIYQNDAFGSGGAKVISDELLANGFTVTSLIVFDIATLMIGDDLKSLLTSSPTRMVVVWAESTHTNIILRKALDVDVVGPRFTWILSSSVPLTSFPQRFHSKLIGMLTLEPVSGSLVRAPTNTTLLNAAYQIWKQNEPESFPYSTEVDYYALFAFDATWLLIQSLRQLYSATSTNSSLSDPILNGSSFCFDRRFAHFDRLLQTISTTEFLGVSGLIGFNADEADRKNGSYYYVRNVQSTSGGVGFTPVLRYVEPGEWQPYQGTHVIVWPGNSLTPPDDRAVLRGTTLRIGMIESPPFTNVIQELDKLGNTTIKLTGYGPSLVELLRQRMGFIPDIQLASTNLTYSEVIQEVVDGVYDIVVGDITVTAARRELVDFSIPIFDSSLRIVMRKTADDDVDFLSYRKPFTTSLWLILLAATVYAGGLLYLLERSENEALQTRPIASAIAMSLWFSFGNIVGYGADFHARTGAGRVLTVGLYVLSLILVASYTANLASDLTTLKSKDIVSGIEDIKNGKIPFSRIGILLGTSIEDYYLREVSGGSHNYYPVKTIEGFFEALLGGVIDAGFLDIGYGEYATNNLYCNLTLVGADFDKSAFSIASRKGWIYERDLDVSLLSLREAGKLDELRSTWFQSSVCSAAQQTTTALSAASMAGLFLTFAATTVVALFVFAWRKRSVAFSLLAKLFKRAKRSTDDIPEV